MKEKSSEREPTPRKDAFFGMHLDLHPQEHDPALGADTSRENIRRLLERVRPDYVQYDCKGHTGYTGYPSKVGWSAPHIVQDALAIWREVTHEYGVGLYIHYSGVYDAVAIEHHPEWACIDAEGKPDANHTSTFGGYADGLLIPQLREVANAYDLDGVWVDGDCWAAQLDYGPAALEQWREETGYAEAPEDRADPRWIDWKMFHRRQFEKYLAHWVDALHASHPRLQVTSNWMYTTFAPKPVEVELNYLSGDAGLARVAARYMASTGMPWDLMAWGFNHQKKEFGHNLKTPQHLQQEAAAILMQGGGFQVYYQPTRSGYIVDQISETTGRVADFCRARQQVSHKSTSVPQVALLLSSEAYWDRSDTVFGNSDGLLTELEGILDALLELHYSVDILAEHQLQTRLAEFPLVVIADAYKLPESFRHALLNYVREGGNLLLVGAACARLFDHAVGVRLEGEPQETPAELISDRGLASVNGSWQKVVLTTAQATGWRYPTRDTRKGGEVAATVASYGRGRIGVIYGPVAEVYFNVHHPALRCFIGETVRRLFADPQVTADAPACVDIALRRTREGQLCVHLLNLFGVQRAERFLSTEWIPPLDSLQIRLKISQEPQDVRWVPEGAHLDWAWSEDTLTVTIPRLDIHGVLVVDTEQV